MRGGGSASAAHHTHSWTCENCDHTILCCLTRLGCTPDHHPSHAATIRHLTLARLPLAGRPAAARVRAQYFEMAPPRGAGRAPARCALLLALAAATLACCVHAQEAVPAAQDAAPAAQDAAPAASAPEQRAAADVSASGAPLAGAQGRSSVVVAPPPTRCGAAFSADFRPIEQRVSAELRARG